MDKKSLEKIKKIPPLFLLNIIKKMKKRLKNDEVIKNLFKEYDLDLDEIDLIPMTFSDINVSAKCDHGIIYLNYKLLLNNNLEKDYSYAVHEITHFCQQTCNDKPTKGSKDGNYLENPYEQEGFQNQIEFLSNNLGEDEAEEYVDNLLSYHKVNKKEKPKLENILMEKI